MKKIHKYVLTLDSETINLPFGSKILFVGNQRNDIYMWVEFLISHKDDLKPRTFEIFGTGSTIPNGSRKYLGSAVLHDGALVFHVYEKETV